MRPPEIPYGSNVKPNLTFLCNILHFLCQNEITGAVGNGKSFGTTLAVHQVF